MDVNQNADYIIIGGGIFGCSTAYNLANQAAKNIFVIEMGDICSGSTSKSCAISRSHYTIESNVLHAVESVKIFENFEEIIGGDNGFIRTGQIVLGPENYREVMESVFHTQNKYGSETQILTRSEACKLHPLLKLEDVDVIGFESISGYCDPYLTTTSYAKRAKDLGVKFFTDTKVIDISQNGLIKNVKTVKGNFESPNLVFASGPWTRCLGEMIGIKFPFEISKHKVLSLKIDTPYKKDWPIVKDLMTPEKIYFRPDSGGLVLVGTGDYGDPIKNIDEMTDIVEMEHVEKIGRRMTHRMPVFENAKLVRSWTGMYDISPDWNPIIGAVPNHEGIFVAVGFSGHGFKSAPTMGEALAQKILGNDPRIPIEMYGMSRFGSGKTLNGAYGVGTFA